VDSNRLDKFERQLDIIVAKLESLVRLEEKHDGAVYRIDRQERRLDRHADRIDTLESGQNESRTSATMIERGFWLILTTVVSVTIYLLGGGG